MMFYENLTFDGKIPLKFHSYVDFDKNLNDKDQWKLWCINAEKSNK